MAVLDEELLRDANEDAQAIKYIQQQLPAGFKKKCSDKLLQQIIDSIVDTLATSDVLDAEPDKDGFVDINIELVAQQVSKSLAESDSIDLSVDDIQLIVDTWLDFDEKQSED